MYKLCKTEQSARRQRQLELGLLAAMGSRRYEEITVSDLCEQLNIPRKSFYRYFSGKDGALHALIDHTLLEYEWFQPEKGRQPRSYQKELERFFRFWLERKPLLEALDHSDICGTLVMRSIQHALSDAGVLEQYLNQKDRQIRHHATMFWVCGLMSMVLSWYKNGFDLSVQQLGEIAAELVTQPLCSMVEG